MSEKLSEPRKGARCSAHRTNGDPCNAFAIKGGTVCNKHGGSAPQVKKKAAERIQEAADPAAANLVRWMGDPKVDMTTRVRIAQDLLDRAGVSKNAKVEVDVGIRRYEQLAASGGILMDIPDEDDDVVDAEVVVDVPDIRVEGSTPRRSRREVARYADGKAPR